DEQLTDPFIDLFQRPCIVLSALNPFEVRDRHATCIGQNVRQDENATFAEDLVRLQSCWTVSTFGQDPAVDAIRISRRDLVLKRAWSQNVASSTPINRHWKSVRSLDRRRVCDFLRSARKAHRYRDRSCCTRHQRYRLRRRPARLPLRESGRHYSRRFQSPVQLLCNSTS